MDAHGSKPIRKAKARFDREKHRLPCEILVLGQSHHGIVTDMSASGLFVQTSELPPTGTTLLIRIRTASKDEIEIHARVTRTRKVSRHVTAVIPSGLGLQIVSAPESYFQLVAALTQKRSGE